jgi:glycosyltransferase involved in cell wall biosynthesis
MSGSPKILVLTNGYPNPHKVYAGMYLKRHVQLHREAGFDVSVLSPFDSRKGLFHSSWKHLRYLLRVISAFFSTDFDLVHSHWILPSGLYGVFLSRIKQKPFVLTSHGDSLHRQDQLAWITTRLIRFVIRNADAVIAVGEIHGDRIQRLAGLDSGQVKVIDMGVLVEGTPLTRLQARQILNLHKEDSVVVFIGNLQWIKGVDVLLGAAAELMNKCEFILYVGGQGPELPKLKTITKKLGIENIVHFIGPVPNDKVSTWMSAADICVVPSRSETFGLVAMEAMACGTPVIASSIDELSENIVHGENGLLFPPEDHTNLSECLYQLLCDPDLRERLAEGGRKTASAHDMRLQAGKVKDIYLALLNDSISKC